MTADKEKKRAVSREAARRRRRVESDIFADLSHLLPLQPSIRAHLDRPSVIRLTLSYLRMHTLLRANPAADTVTYAHATRRGRTTVAFTRTEWDAGQDELEKEMAAVQTAETDMFLGILEGFLMVVSTEGDMMFLSENVSKYLGFTQTELMGHNIFQYAHPCDHQEIRNNLCVTADEVWCGAKREFAMRIKSALNHRGRITNMKSATWKVLHCQGRAKVCDAPSAVSCLLLTCQSLPLSHTHLSAHTFTSQHSMDMRFTHCDQRVTPLLGYQPEELVGRTIYEFCHILDTNCLSRNHNNLCVKSQSVSGQYRMLVRGGGYVWVESHSAIIPSVRPRRSRPAAQQPLCILSVTYVLSSVMESSLQLSLDQSAQRYIT